MSQHTILFVDDEENILNSLKRALRQEKYQVITAASGPEGLKALEEHPVEVVVSDQRMPEMSGTEFMTHVMRRYPDAVRIILSGYTDVDTITQAVNKGHVYKFLLKPWNDEVLKMEIDSAFTHYDLVNMNKLLNQKILDQNEELKRYNETLEAMIKNRTRELEIQNQALELSQEILENIPVPVIGISEDGAVVLINGMASRLSFDGRKMVVGGNFADYFPERITEILSRSLAGKTLSCIKDHAVGGEKFDIDFCPLSGKENRSGAILLFKRREP